MSKWRLLHTTPNLSAEADPFVTQVPIAGAQKINTQVDDQRSDVAGIELMFQFRDAGGDTLVQAKQTGTITLDVYEVIDDSDGNEVVLASQQLTLVGARAKLIIRDFDGSSKLTFRMTAVSGADGDADHITVEGEELGGS